MILHILMDLFLALGLFFALAGTKGIIKMPDTFSRMQASTCVATLGMLGVMIGALIYAIGILGSTSTAIKIVLIALLVLVTNPIGSHILARGAYKAGIRPEKKMETDELGRDFDE